MPQVSFIFKAYLMNFLFSLIFYRPVRCSKMCIPQTNMAKRPGNPQFGPRHPFYYLTCLIFYLFFLGVLPATVHSSSPPVHEGAVAGDSQAVRGSPSLNIRPGNDKASSSTPLVSLLVSATSSSSASVPTSLAASSSTLGLLASSDQELDNETSNDQPVTKTQPPITTDEAGDVPGKGELLPNTVPKSGSGRITANKRGYKCENGTGKCDTFVSKSSLNKQPQKEKPIAESTTKQTAEEKSTASGPHIEKSTAKSPQTTDEKFQSSSMVQSSTATPTGTPTTIEISTTSPQSTTTTATTTKAKSSSSSSTTAAVPPKTTIKKGKYISMFLAVRKMCSA